MQRNPFKHHRFPPHVILWAVRWYCRFSLSCRDVRDLLAERASMWTLPRSIAGFASLAQRSQNGHSSIDLGAVKAGTSMKSTFELVEIGVKFGARLIRMDSWSIFVSSRAEMSKQKMLF